MCRFLNDVFSPTLRVLEPWFRPQLTNDDLVTLQEATHGQYLVATSTFLGYFELAFVRARRNYLNMEENLLTPRCGVRFWLVAQMLYPAASGNAKLTRHVVTNCYWKILPCLRVPIICSLLRKGQVVQEVVVMYLQVLPTTRIRIVPTELVWLPAEVLDCTYSCLRHVIHTLVLASLLHSPAVPQSDRCEGTYSKNVACTGSV
jgi:hypothetical protein